MTGKQLLNSILQEAIHGRLVPQDPNDEPAETMLRRLNPKAEIITDNDQFQDLPKGWCVTTLKSIAQLYTGDSINQQEKTSKYTNVSGKEYIGTKDISFDHIVDYNNGIAIPDKYISNFRIAPEGAVLLCIEGGSAGRKIAQINKSVCFGNKLCCFDFYDFAISKYIYYYLQSNDFIRNFKQDLTGLIGGVSVNKLKAIIFPLPPLAEQERIVKKIREVMPLVERYAQSEMALEKINANIKPSLKKSILQEAIQGKLVPQDPNDEPAIELLKRINPKAEIISDKKLPKGWELCRLGDIIDIISGVSYKKENICLSGIKVIRGGNIQNGQIVEKEDDVYINDSYKNEQNTIKKKDIVMVASTGSSLLIGKTGFAKNDYLNTQIGAFLRIIRAKNLQISAFLNLIFNSPYYKKYIRSLAKGTNINNIKNDYITEFIIPLPPLAEQKRIVEKIEQIFALIDRIEVNL